MKRTFIVCACITALLSACSSEKNGTADTTSQPVRVDTVKLSCSNTVLQFPGKVKTSLDAAMSFKVAGRIKKIFVDEGSTVRKGQLIAELDDTDYRIQLEATEAEYAQIKAQADRVIALYDDNGATPNDYDKAVYGLRQITAKRNAHREQLGYTKIYAPFDGKVQSKLFNDHETVAAGMPVLTLIGGSQPEVEIFLSAADYMERSRIAQYFCEFSVIPGMKFPLKVIRVAPQANANQLYSMRLSITNPDKGTMPSPGMSTLVTAVYKASDNGSMSLIVPSGAVFNTDKQEWVYVYDTSKHTISRREVRLVQLLSNEQSIVSSSTLRVGDIVIASGTHSLKEGEMVTPINPYSETNVGGIL